MEVKIDGKIYNVNVEKKNNKNIYLRVKEDMKIYVTAPYLVTDKRIKRFVIDNEDYIVKMLNEMKKKNLKKNYFYLLGEKYNIIFDKNEIKTHIEGNNVITKNENTLESFKKRKAMEIFSDRLEICYLKFEEPIKYPDLRIYKMKRKWGHCNKRDLVITLNLELIEYSYSEIDYVIIHELAHLVHFNHSKAFWSVVKKYKPDYKENKKRLKE